MIQAPSRVLSVAAPPNEVVWGCWNLTTENIHGGRALFGIESMMNVDERRVAIFRQWTTPMACNDVFNKLWPLLCLCFFFIVFYLGTGVIIERKPKNIQLIIDNPLHVHVW